MLRIVGKLYLGSTKRLEKKKELRRRNEVSQDKKKLKFRFGSLLVKNIGLFNINYFPLFITKKNRDSVYFFVKNNAIVVEETIKTKNNAVNIEMLKTVEQ